MSDSIAIVETGSSVAVVSVSTGEVAIAEAPVALVHESEKGVVLLTEAGQGLPGTSGAPETIPVSWADVTARAVFVMPAAGQVRSASLDITTAWTGEGATLTVGVAGSPDMIIGPTQCDPAIEATFESMPCAHLAAGDTVFVFNSPGAGCDRGAATLVLELAFD